MSIRMVPIGPTFNGFRRLVRDLSAELGKEIELETLGTETELDKSVIDKLHDPLVHIVRNSIDHGIETPDVREARGKPRGGKIRLGAAPDLPPRSPRHLDCAATAPGTDPRSRRRLR